MSYLCYCLQKSGGSGKGPLTYVGCTNNFSRRIRQHNGEIKGGAKCTTKACLQGAFWNPIVFAVGFIDNKEALSFEWHWKFETRKIKSGLRTERRFTALEILLKKERFFHIKKEIPKNEKFLLHER